MEPISFMKSLTCSLLLCAALNQVFAQSMSISGNVYSKSGVRVSYVNIGIKGRRTGTVSDEAGHFRIEIPDSLQKETLTFSRVGYLERTVPIASNLLVKPVEIILVEKVIELAEVKIGKNRSKIRKLGTTGRTPFIMTPSESYNANDIIEQGRRISIKEPIRLLKASIYLAQSDLDSVTLRLNFYSLENQLPGERLIEKNIIKTFPVKKGWLTFDLNEAGIFINKDFVVSFEYLPDEKTARKKYDYFSELSWGHQIVIGVMVVEDHGKDTMGLIVRYM
jgi:hypothetical protein